MLRQPGKHKLELQETTCKQAVPFNLEITIAAILYDISGISEFFTADRS